MYDDFPLSHTVKHVDLRRSVNWGIECFELLKDLMLSFFIQFFVNQLVNQLDVFNRDVVIIVNLFELIDTVLNSIQFIRQHWSSTDFSCGQCICVELETKPWLVR